MMGSAFRLVARLAVAWAVLGGVAATGAQAQNAYVPNNGDNNVSVIDTRTGTLVGSPVTVGDQPRAVAVAPDGRLAYIVNRIPGTVSVINAATNAVVRTIPVASDLWGIAVTPDGSRLYVTSVDSDSVAVIDTRTNAVVKTIEVGDFPMGVEVTRDGKKVYVANFNDGTVSVIDTATAAVVGDPIAVGSLTRAVAVNPKLDRAYVTFSGSVAVLDTTSDTVLTSLGVGLDPRALAVTPDGTRLYVANQDSDNVSVINTATDAVLTTIPAGNGPSGAAVTPDGGKVYVTNEFASNVSVIATASNEVVGDPIPVGDGPIGFGRFIGPATPVFAGKPGAANCAARSLSAEARRYGGTSAAARALGYGSVAKMQLAIRAFCAG